MTKEADYLTADALLSLTGINHAFFTRGGGLSDGIYASLNAGLGSDDDRSNVVENRKRMALALGSAKGDIASPYQIHSPDVILATDIFTEDRPKADGIVTATPGLPIGIVTGLVGGVFFVWLLRRQRA